MKDTIIYIGKFLLIMLVSGVLYVAGLMGLGMIGIPVLYSQLGFIVVGVIALGVIHHKTKGI